MPDLDAIPPVYHQPNDPYNYVYDNLPLTTIYRRQELINDAVDINSNILREAVGTQGTLSNRLAQSINPDGSLKLSALDSAEHNIASHSDGSAPIAQSELDALNGLGYSVSNPVAFVRMTLAERDKLALVAAEATSLRMEVQTPSTTVLFQDNNVIFANSDSIEWRVDAPNRLTANLALPLDLPHRHFYDRVPVPESAGNPDYIHYKVTSVATPFTSGTLRTHVNGIRLSANSTVYVPPANGPEGTWTLTGFTEDAENGRFFLNRALSSSDVITIDFDTAFG